MATNWEPRPNHSPSSYLPTSTTCPKLQSKVYFVGKQHMQKFIIAERKGNKCLCAVYLYFQVSWFFFFFFLADQKHAGILYLMQQRQGLAQVPKVWCVEPASCSAGEVLYLLFFQLPLAPRRLLMGSSWDVLLDSLPLSQAGRGASSEVILEQTSLGPHLPH